MAAFDPVTNETIVYDSYQQGGQQDLNIPITFGATAVTSVNGLSGPTITFTGGTSGFTYSASVATITLVSPLTTKGDIYTHDGSAGVRKAVGANGTVVTADSAEATGWKWAAAGSPATADFPPIFLLMGA